MRGNLVLILSRANGPNGQTDYNPSTGVLERQRKLDEIVEMFHIAQAVVNTAVLEDPEARVDLAKLAARVRKHDLHPERGLSPHQRQHWVGSPQDH